MDDLEAIAKRLGNPLTRGGSAVMDAELLELLAHAEQLADLTERCARIGRTLAHAAEDERSTSSTVLLVCARRRRRGSYACSPPPLTRWCT